MSSAIFHSWAHLAQVLVTGVGAYVGLLSLLRVFGKRTLAKLNAFDLVVTVALGSTLATVILPPQPSLADGLLALAVLIFAQFGVAWLQVRSRGFRRIVKSDPAVLLRQGRWLDDALERERVSRDEVLAALRSSGVAWVDEAEAVVLETDGSFSVLRRNTGRQGESTLGDVRGS